ncbi:cytochrome b/b6 domain-containing protein [Pseudomonas sp. PDM18]|uniref:cytochrome b n=1 Tax=unclassified Pseudomonas TaxID=196821 RepID=UPI00178227ED|nr:cytochrome b/b6 domain-containing protein [Pseudomonas sp. PDM18]MBD9676621.1 cytochrome b/b6 domain-containing protein [Pseudomonas sp. PDM18]
MNAPVESFHPLLRLLHGLMAVLVIATLFVGVTMVASVGGSQPQLVAWHKQLGLALLVLLLVRLLVRAVTARPALPASVTPWQRRLACAVHFALYALLLGQILVGWAMQGAADFPLRFAHWLVPALVGANPDLYGILRCVHAWIAYGLFALILLHAAAALVHALLRRDGVWSSMWRVRSRRKEQGNPAR